MEPNTQFQQGKAQDTSPRLHSFDLSEFKSSIDAMIATSDTGYHSIYEIGRTRRVKEYTEEDIKRIIESGALRAQQDLSYSYYSIDGYYRRICIYYATLLKYVGLVVPEVSQSHKITEDSVSRRYYNACDFVEKARIPSLATNMMLKAIVYGAYYGVVQTLDKEHFTVLDLPTSYCYTRYKDVDGNDLIEFDLAYFNTLSPADGTQARALKAYPQEIVSAWRKWKKGKISQYYLIPSSIGICIPFYDGRPFFLPTIPDIVNYRDYGAMEKKKDNDEIKKILIQQIPHLNDGSLLFEPPEAEEIHRGTVNMMKNNSNISVLTTYADVDVQGTNTQNESVTKNNLEKIANTVYRSAGVSPQLFASNSNLALTVSLQNDLSMVMPVANKIATFIQNAVNALYANTTVKFKYTILPISYYNEKDYLDQAYKLATVGYSALVPALATGFSQKDLVNIKNLENNLLKLKDALIPLKTSYTESSNDGAGRPTLPDSEKSDKTIQNIQSQSNGDDGTGGE